MQIHQNPVPLRVDDSGTIRLGKSRVMLELVWEAHRAGASPEYIVNQMFPTLALADVYAAIAYCLRYPEETNAYLGKQAQQAERVRKEVEAKYPAAEFKARILARKVEMERAGPLVHSDAEVSGG